MSYLAELLKNALAMVGILALLFFILESQRARTATEIRAMGSETIAQDLKTQAFEARRAAREVLSQVHRDVGGR